MTEAERKLAAILSADVVGYSRLMAEDEAATISTLRAYREEIAMLVRQHRGRVVDTPGDNVLAEFPTALDAVRCAVEIQGVLRARNASLPTERRMDFRVGVHMGDVAVDEGKVYGDGVNIAARLEALAEAGGICISATVREQVRNKLDVGYVDLGDQTVKNIPDQVHVYRIQPRSEPEEPARESVSRGERRSRLRAVLIAGAAALLLAVVGIVAWLVAPDEFGTAIVSEEGSLLALPTGPTVAVLPFENLSGDPAQEFFSDGLTDEIITELSRFKDLFVIARNSTFQYKGQAVDVRQLRQDLGARYVLEGSVQKAGSTLRVTVQLLDAKDGTHLWAESYDRELSAAGIFDVQDEISEQVVATIAGYHGVISRTRFAEVKEKPTDSLDAYEWVLRADAYERDNYVAPEHARLRDGLESAVKSDPSYADAWAQLSFIYVDEYKHSYNPRPDPLDRALKAARRAVSLDPSNQRARHALANVYFFRRELDSFFAEMERTIVLNPNHAPTLANFGNLLLNVGEERGITFARKAVALDPFHPTWFHFSLALYHFDRGEYHEALAAMRKVDVPTDFWHHVFFSVIYAELGRQTDASSALEELRKLRPGFTIEKYIEEERKWNRPEAAIDHWASALRKAGLPE